jgi:hypothetical protein
VAILRKLFLCSDIELTALEKNEVNTTTGFHF